MTSQGTDAAFNPRGQGNCLLLSSRCLDTCHLVWAKPRGPACDATVHFDLDKGQSPGVLSTQLLDSACFLTQRLMIPQISFSPTCTYLTARTMSLFSWYVLIDKLSLELRHFVQRQRQRRRKPPRLERRITRGQQTPAEKQFRTRPTGAAHAIRADILRLFFDTCWYGSQILPRHLA